MNCWKGYYTQSADNKSLLCYNKTYFNRKEVYTMANMGSIEERVLAFNNEEDAKFIFNKSFDELSLNEQIILRRYQNDQMNPVL